MTNATEFQMTNYRIQRCVSGIGLLASQSRRKVSQARPRPVSGQLVPPHPCPTAIELSQERGFSPSPPRSGGEGRGEEERSKTLPKCCTTSHIHEPLAPYLL